MAHLENTWGHWKIDKNGSEILFNLDEDLKIYNRTFEETDRLSAKQRRVTLEIVAEEKRRMLRQR